MPLLKIVRAPATTDQTRSYSIILDGKNIGQVFNGQTKTLPLSAGQHRLRLKADWRGSNTLDLNVGKEETVQFAIKARFAPTNTLANLWCMLLAWSSYLLLEVWTGPDVNAKQHVPQAKPAKAETKTAAPPLPAEPTPEDAPQAAAETEPRPAAPAADAALQAVIAERKKEDPLFGLKVSARELVVQLVASIKTDKGIHIESLLTALGALAGYACQMSVREEWVNSGKLPEHEAFVVRIGADGRKYYFGKLVTKPLVENPYSLWSLAAGAARESGSTELPDLLAIFKHVAGTVGNEQFGIPNVPEQHKAGDLPVNYVKNLWPKFTPVITMFADSPADWPIVMAIAAQQIIEMANKVIDSKTAVTIVMESAIPMSGVLVGVE